MRLPKWPLNVGLISDCYDRYLIRMAEMRQSLKLIFRAVHRIRRGPISLAHKAVKPVRAAIRRTMEGTIQHFKYFAAGPSFLPASNYVAIEAPKGEFGITAWFAAIISHRLSRCKVRAPGFYHLAGLDLMARNALVSDVVAIIGTQDIVFGEVDR
jgi:NADH dehydrogenase (ubiquinone) Fe-S protein 2